MERLILEALAMLGKKKFVLLIEFESCKWHHCERHCEGHTLDVSQDIWIEVANSQNQVSLFPTLRTKIIRYSFLIIPSLKIFSNA